MSDSITVSRKMLQLVFDSAVNSIDFSSGFLDDEEVVDGLRACAVALGVDPMIGTPERFRCKFEGHHVAAHPQSASPWQCPRCRGVLDPDAPREVEVSRDFDTYKYQVTMAQFAANAPSYVNPTEVIAAVITCPIGESVFFRKEHSVGMFRATRIA